AGSDQEIRQRRCRRGQRETDQGRRTRRAGYLGIAAGRRRLSPGRPIPVGAPHGRELLLSPSIGSEELAPMGRSYNHGRSYNIAMTSSTALVEVPPPVLRVADLAFADLAALLSRHDLQLQRVGDGAPIPG